MREKDFPFAKIEEKIGYAFKDKALLKEAFTHSSYANANGGRNNERMEYLGDAVLQLVITEWQYLRHEKAEEGILTRERQRLVCEESLLEAVEALGLENYLLYFGGKANIGKKTVSSLFETVTAAIYLDGGYEPARAFILTHGRVEEEAFPTNYKGALQEYLQKQGKQLPSYQVKKTGKDNAPLFQATAFADGVSAVGDGRSKKEAEQEAALLLLEKLKR